MHKSLISTCRCGRARSDLHLLKCLQNQPEKCNENDVEKNFTKLPETSNGKKLLK